MIGEEVIAYYGDAGDGEELFEKSKLVRCEDCIYWTYDDLYDEYICGNSEWTGVGVKADDYCSYGERIDNE